MEIEGKCGICSTRFALPDNVLRGFWRNGGGNKDPANPFRISEGLEESLVGETYGCST